RVGGGARGHERPLPQRAAALSECLPAVGQALEESPQRRSGYARLRQTQDTLAAGAPLEIRRPRKSQRTSTPDRGPRSIQTLGHHRPEARRDSASGRQESSSKNPVPSRLGSSQDQRYRNAGGDSEQHSRTHDQRRQFNTRSHTQKSTKGALPTNGMTMNFGNISYELTNHPSV